MAKVDVAEPVVVLQAISKTEVEALLHLKPSAYSLLRQAQALHIRRLLPEDRQDLEQVFRRNLKSFKDLHQKLKGVKDYGDIVKILSDPKTKFIPVAAEPPHTPASQKGDATAVVPAGLTQKSPPSAKAKPTAGSQVQKYLEANKVAYSHLAQLYAQANIVAEQTYNNIITRMDLAGIANPESLVSLRYIQAVARTAVISANLPFTTEALAQFTLKQLESSPTVRRALYVAQKAPLKTGPNQPPPPPTVEAALQTAFAALSQDQDLVDAHAELTQPGPLRQALTANPYPQVAAANAAKKAISDNRPDIAIYHLETLKQGAAPAAAKDIASLQSDLAQNRTPRHFNQLVDTLASPHSTLYDSLTPHVGPDQAKQIESAVELTAITQGPLDQAGAKLLIQQHLPKNTAAKVRQAVIADDILDQASALSLTAPDHVFSQVAVPKNLSPHRQLLKDMGHPNPSALTDRQVLHTAFVISYAGLSPNQQASIAQPVIVGQISQRDLIEAFTSPQALVLYRHDQDSARQQMIQFAGDMTRPGSLWRQLFPKTFEGVPEISPHGVFDLVRSQLGLTPAPGATSPGLFAQPRLFFSHIGQSFRSVFSGGFRSGVSNLASGIGAKLAPLKAMISQGISLIKPAIQQVVSVAGKAVMSVGRAILSWGGKLLTAAGGKLVAVVAAVGAPEIAIAVVVAIMATATLAIIFAGGFLIFRHFRMLKVDSAQIIALSDYGVNVPGVDINGDGIADVFPDTAGPIENLQTVVLAPGSALCWPTNGQLSQHDSAAHATTAGASAIDINDNIGDPVVSLFSGTITETGYASDYGGYVKMVADVTQADGTVIHPEFLFGHLSEISVSAGQQVVASQQVGLKGNNGNSTGPHLHLEVRGGYSIYDFLPVDIRGRGLYSFTINELCYPEGVTPTL